MRRIFHQKRKSYDKTCRLAAAEILLDNHPLPMDAINILLATSEMETEMATFLLLKVQDSLRGHHHMAKWGLRGWVHFPPLLYITFFSSSSTVQLWVLDQRVFKMCQHHFMGAAWVFLE